VLFSDAGFPGMVIRMQNDSIEMQNKEGQIHLIVGAGTSLAKLANFARDNGLAGLEWAAGIPGTVGGAIRGNAGAFHQEIGNAVVKVRAVEISDKDFMSRVFEKSQCDFAYRDSIFKQNKKLVIVSGVVGFLKKGSLRKLTFS